MNRLAPILMAYDGECSLCRRMVDWVQRRDRWGLIIAFPIQNPELPRVAPELAGRPLHLEIHAVDTGSRAVYAGAEVLPQILSRLPRWCILAPLLSIPGAAILARRVYFWIAARRYSRTGRASFRD